MILEAEDIVISEHIPVLLHVGMLVGIAADLHTNITQPHKIVFVNKTICIE